MCSLFIWGRISLWSSYWPGAPCVDQAGLELELPASVFQQLGLKVCATKPDSELIILLFKCQNLVIF